MLKRYTVTVKQAAEGLHTALCPCCLMVSAQDVIWFVEFLQFVAYPFQRGVVAIVCQVSGNEDKVHRVVGIYLVYTLLQIHLCSITADMYVCYLSKFEVLPC